MFLISTSYIILIIIAILILLVYFVSFVMYNSKSKPEKDLVFKEDEDFKDRFEE